MVNRWFVGTVGLLIGGLFMTGCANKGATKGIPGPLVGVPLESLCLDAFESGAQGDRAWLVDLQGRRFGVVTNELIGLNDGMVVAIANDAVQVVEILDTPEGGWQGREARIEPCAPTEPKIDHNADPM